MKKENIYLKLANFGKELLNKKSLQEGIPLISQYAKDVIHAQRCSIFIYDTQKDSLWTTLSDGVKKIEIDSNKGVVGQTIKDKKSMIVNHTYHDPSFMADIDKATGFDTKNLITAPIFNSQGEVMGVLELLNKEGGFHEEDLKFMKFFAHNISGFLELILHIKENPEN
jgi:GAF domain-containing protein